MKTSDFFTSRMSSRLLFSAALAVGCAAAGGARLLHAAGPLEITPVKRTSPVGFYRDIQPILKANCIACHNKTTTKADLNMETPELMIKGGESGPGLVPGKAMDSLILQSSAHLGDGPMPPKGNKVGAVNLTPEELGLLKLWIDEGAHAGEQHSAEIVWQALPAGLNPIFSVAISQDGEFVACSRANQVFIYHLPSKTMVTRLTDEGLVKSGLYKQPGVAHRDVVTSLAFSPDGSHLATGSYREVKLWKLERPAPVVTKVKPPAPAAEGAAAAPPTPASAAPPAPAPAPPPVDPALAAALKLIDKKPDRPSSALIAGIQNAVAAATFETTYQNGVVQKNEADIKALDERIKKAQDSKAAAEKILPDKRKEAEAAVAARTATEKVAKEAADALAAMPKDKPDKAIEQKDKDSQEKLKVDTKTAMDAEVALNRAERAITDADAETKLVGENKVKIEAAIAEAKAALAAAKANSEKATKDLEAARKAGTDALKPMKLSVLSDDKKLLATAHEDGAVRLWAADTGLPIATHQAFAAVPTQLAWEADGSVSATGTDGSRWTLGLKPQWKFERTLGTGGDKSPISDRANAVRFSADGKTLAAGSGEPSRSGDITLWEVGSGKLLQNWPDRHRDSVLSLDFSPDGKQLASGGADKAVRVFQVTDGKQVKLFEGHTHHVLGVAWRNDGRILASAGADNVVKIWDMLTGDRKKNIEGWDKEVTSVQFVGPADQMLTTSGDSKVRVVRDSGGEVRLLPGPADFMQGAAATRTGDIMVAGGQDSILRIWDGTSGKELAVFAETNP